MLNINFNQHLISKISMLKQFANVIRYTSMNTNLPRLSFQTKIKNGFCQKKPTNIIQLLEKIIQEQQNKNKPNIEGVQANIQSKGWKINHNSMQIQFSRQNKHHSLRLLSKVTPLKSKKQLQQKQNQYKKIQLNPLTDFQIQLFISRDKKNWMLIDVMIVSLNNIEILGVTFIDNYQKYKNQKRCNSFVKPIYGGPQLNSLQQNITKGLLIFFQQQNLSNSLLINCANYTQFYQRKFYLNWLQKIQQVL